MGKLTLILGGARSGKSTYAERLAMESSKRIGYIATAQALDEEMVSRIRAHREKRPAIWQTVEWPSRIGQTWRESPIAADIVLLDCLTLLVSNLMMQLPQHEENPDEELAFRLVSEEIAALQTAIEASAADWVIVSNEVGMGLVPPYPLGRVYRDMLGWANQRLASRADEVVLMVAGLPWQLKPYKK